MKKSNEVVFSSERMERRRYARRFWIPAAAAAVMFAAVIAVALLTRSDRGRTFTGEDSPFPYTWKEEKNGNVTLEIDRPDGYQWTVTDAGAEALLREADGAVARESETDAVLDVRPDGKQPKDKMRFLLKPLSPGRVTLALGLLNAADPVDQIGELTVLMEAREENGRLNAYLLSASGRALQGVIHGGEGSGWLYTGFMNEYGNLVLLVADETPPEEEEEPEPEPEPEPDVEDEAGPESYYGYTWEEYMALPGEERDALIEAHRGESETAQGPGMLSGPSEPAAWECVSDNPEAVEVLAVLSEDGVTAAYLMPGSEPGTAGVELTFSAGGVKLALKCEVDEAGDFRVTSHALARFEPGENPA